MMNPILSYCLRKKLIIYYSITMIKNSTYIRSFTPRQKQQMETISASEKIKTADKVLLFTLEKHQEQKQEIERLKRIIQYKQNKIETLKLQLDASI